MFKRKFFVVCPDYHGATLLAKLLNAHPSISTLGDTYPSNRFDQTCGCGNLVSRCTFWREIKEKVDATRYLSEPSILPLYPQIVDHRFDRLMYIAAPLGLLRRAVSVRMQKAFVEDYARFLAAVYDQQDDAPDVFVDGVKSLSRVQAMVAFNQNDVDGVIHLMREPRDFVQSYMKTRSMSTSNLCKAAAHWRLYHSCAMKFKAHVPYLQVRYEALTAETDVTLSRLFHFLGVSTLTVTKMREGMSKTWHFMGNASLFKFDGRIGRSHHCSGHMEGLVVRSLAGRY